MGVAFHPEETEVSFYFNHLHQHCFYPGKTEHTTDCAHSTQVLVPSTYSSLHALNHEEEKDHTEKSHVMITQVLVILFTSFTVTLTGKMTPGPQQCQIFYVKYFTLLYV